MTVRLPGEWRGWRLEGAPLTAVLKAVNVPSSAGLTVTAQGGYAVEIAGEEIIRHDWLLAYVETGRWPWQAFMTIVAPNS